MLDPPAVRDYALLGQAGRLDEHIGFLVAAEDAGLIDEARAMRLSLLQLTLKLAEPDADASLIFGAVEVGRQEIMLVLSRSAAS